MKEKIKVSIIVPFYNVELYFRDFLDSLLPIENNCEVLLVNDGSKDSSVSIAKDFTSRFENIKLLTKENGGLSSARNYGFEYATGEYVIFFDSDDYIENRNSIMDMYETAKKYHSDIVVAPYYEFFNLNDKKYRFDKVNFDSDLILLEDRMNKLFNNDISFAVWNKMFNYEFLKKNQLKFKEGIWFEDLEFVFRAFYYANKISKVNNILVGYRQREGSIMKTLSLKILDKIHVLDELYLFLKRNKTIDDFYEKFKILYLRMAFSVIHSTIINKGDSKVKEDVLNKIFKFSFFNIILMEPLVFKKYLSNVELVMFYLLKYKIIKRSNIYVLGFFSHLKK